MFCKATVQQWTKTNPDGSVTKTPPRLEIKDISLLDTVMEKYTKSIKIQMLISQLSVQFVEHLSTAMRKHKGQVPVKEIVALPIDNNDKKEIRKLEFSNSAHEVNPREFVSYMRQAIPDIDLSIESNPIF